jgi:hypothetical protein
LLPYSYLGIQWLIIEFCRSSENDEDRHLQRKLHPATAPDRSRLDRGAQARRHVLAGDEGPGQDFPAEAIKKAGYHATFRGMKGYNGVATLTREAPEKIIFGLHEGPDNEDFRIMQTVVSGIPIINSYVPQGYSITSEKYALKLAWFSAPASLFRHGA